MINTLASTPATTQTEYIPFLLQYAFANNFSVALWRLPNETTTHLLISKQPQRLTDEQLIIEELPTGFVFAPFERNNNRFFLAADLIFSFSNGKLNSPESAVQTSSQAWLEGELKKVSKILPVRPYLRTPRIADATKDEFLNLVNTSRAEIEKNIFEKVVPSRTKTFALENDLDVLSTFERLSARYSSALVSFVSCPETGTWMGATPEVLVSVADKTIFKTVALAGTQPYTEGTNLRSVAWTQKEIEEQALVERYIISCFKKIRLREYEEHGPKTSVAGNLVHLKSDFTVNMKETNFPQLGSIMLQLLHPTAAVCGMPLESSLEFLITREGYEREFYSGYLGPVNVNNNIDIFVNLRCLQLLEKKVILYAGAGVTIDSVPEQEWEETEMKFNTLASVLIS